jgi:hypothetical protein
VACKEKGIIFATTSSTYFENASAVKYTTTYVPFTTSFLPNNVEKKVNTVATVTQ